MLDLSAVSRAGCVGLVLGAMLVGHASGQASRVSVSRVPAACRPVRAQLAGDGAIHLLFDSPDGPRYAKSTDEGQSFSEPLLVVDPGSLESGLVFQAEDLAIGRDGRVHVALSSNAWKLKLPQEQWGFYYAALAPQAKSFTALRNLNRKPSEGFSLAADASERVSACFLSGKLYSMNSADHGETFSASAEPDPAWNPCDCCTTRSAYGTDGKLALLYREETDNERDMFVAIWDPLGSAKPLRKRISDTRWKLNACPMTYFSIERAATGYVAAWPTQGRVYFARLDQDGSVLAPGEIRTPGTTGMRSGIWASSAPDGATLVAWKNEDVLGWQLYDAKSQPQGEPGSEPSPGHGAAGAVLGNGRFIVFP